MRSGSPIPLRQRAAAQLELRRRQQAKQFTDPDIVHWIDSHFWIPEANDGAGGPIVLMEYQKAVLREAVRTDAEGKFVYDVVVWSDIKKSAKSTIAAARALWAAFQNHWGSVKIVANDLKQADSRVAYYLRRAIELNKELDKIATIKPSGYQVRLPNRTIIEAIPVDPSGEAGGNDDVIVFSELWAAKNVAAQRMWTEMTLSPTKAGYSQRWVETYAGFSGESILLEMLYEKGVKRGEHIGAQIGFPDLELYRNGKMLVMWNQTPRCPWQTDEYYASEAMVLTESEFNRVHRNQWASSEEKFVPIEWWDNCRDDAMPDLVKDDTPCIVAMDAAVSNDSFGLLMLSGRQDIPGCELEIRQEFNEDGDLINETVIPHYDIRYANAWTPPPGGKIDFQGTPENPGPETELRRLLAENNVVEVVYDPFQLEDMAGRLATELIARLYPFNQAQPRLIADKGLQDKIRNRRIHHKGEVELREHIDNANAKVDAEERKLRIIKRAQHLKVDLAVCASMAADRAEFWRL